MSLISNSDIRAHLRKGELAVELLENLGYTFAPNVPKGPSVWQKPIAEQILDPMVKALEKLIADRVAEQIPSPKQLETGDRFVITSLPAGHRLRLECADWKHRVFTARVVEYGVQAGEVVVRFGINHMNRGYWLRLHHTTKVHDNADF
ncbi:conserved hypothetical protein [Pseudomonas phage phiIBB-PF7A]|uniref:Uncharacterized protein n=1 Tax=Pseudomonas phage phiIBB-PF7A TaxID=942165 RepID=E9KIF6_9CAUD|nr:hypothetical protein phiIBB-PF7Ap18 [Pseudomonas phage phiIBB-PF7A]ADV35681.1 conserved hypothetical protein [Pseudomonas phage phiIBB-PF7A]